MGKKKKVEHKEGWLEFRFIPSDYTKYEKELTKFLKQSGCVLVGVVAKSKKWFALYYYQPKLYESLDGMSLFVGSTRRRLDQSRWWIHDHHSQKPWDLMSAEEKKEDQSLAGRVLTQQDNRGGSMKVASVVFVVSQVPHKDEKIIPTYICWEVDIADCGDRDITTSCGKMRYTSQELRQWNENDLSFLVRYGAPRQIVVDQIKKQRNKAQKQVSNWDKMLKQAEEI